jgi:DNA repair protein RecN (Recombination protein N)
MPRRGRSAVEERAALLRTLRIKNFAIIDELELSFEPGLNIITGETGAGKTVLLQALATALGEKPERQMVRGGAREAAVEVEFLAPPEAAGVLESGGFPAGEEVVVRRLVAPNGRTRSYANGSLASASVLEGLAPHLVRVYGQHEHEALRRVETHGELLDAFGGLGATVEEMRRRHDALDGARRALAALHARREAARARTELVRFQLDELGRAAVAEGEEALLQAERVKGAGAERLRTLAHAAEEALYSADGAVVDVVGRVIGQLREMEAVDADLGDLRALLEGVLAQLEEAGVWMARYADHVDSDPERLAVVEARLTEIGRLARKYGVRADELSRLRAALEAELANIEVSDERLGSAEEVLGRAQRDAVAWAGKLSVERRQLARELERRMDAELATLGMAGARFTVQFADPNAEGRAVGPRGWDDVEFHLAANRGEPARPLARVASGGELSRIILALKTLGATAGTGAALIFDEVDAGVGGAVAEVVGRKLKALAAGGQVICITHLPQIAAFADHHFSVAKETVRGRTVVQARRLDPREQVAELARMLGGETIGAETRAHAEQMLRSAEQKP